MTTPVSRMERLVTLLGGWPVYFGGEEKKHGESILGVLRRDRTIDEAVFFQVIRYAVNRAKYDKLCTDILADILNEAVDQKSGDHYLSGKEQSRYAYANKCMELERELLATPYARAKNGQSAQTSFMEKLDELPPEDGGGAKVMPFKPLAKKGRG